MANNYLISVEDLKKKGLIHQNTDTKVLKTCIKRVQDMNIQPATGSILYRALLDRVANNDWNTAYRTLQNDYVIPALVALVDYKVALYNNEKIRNKATGRSTDENLAANTDADTIYFRDELHKDAEFYLERLIGFLRDDCGEVYTEYKEATTRTNHDMKKDSSGYARKNWIV